MALSIWFIFMFFFFITSCSHAILLFPFPFFLKTSLTAQPTEQRRVLSPREPPAALRLLRGETLPSPLSPAPPRLNLILFCFFSFLFLKSHHRQKQFAANILSRKKNMWHSQEAAALHPPLSSSFTKTWVAINRGHLFGLVASRNSAQRTIICVTITADRSAAACSHTDPMQQVSVSHREGAEDPSTDCLSLSLSLCMPAARHLQ